MGFDRCRTLSLYVNKLEEQRGWGWGVLSAIPLRTESYLSLFLKWTRYAVVCWYRHYYRPCNCDIAYAVSPMLLWYSHDVSPMLQWLGPCYDVTKMSHLRHHYDTMTSLIMFPVLPCHRPCYCIAQATMTLSMASLILSEHRPHYHNIFHSVLLTLPMLPLRFQWLLLHCPLHVPCYCGVAHLTITVSITSPLLPCHCLCCHAIVHVTIMPSIASLMLPLHRFWHCPL